MDQQMHKYTYDGPVMEFDRCVQEHFKAETYAVSEKKARSNFTFQWKKQNGRVARTRIELPGKIVKAS